MSTTNSGVQLDERQAFNAMRSFLEMYWRRGRSEEIAMLLGSLAIQQDGKPADPALWNDWMQSVEFCLRAK